MSAKDHFGPCKIEQFFRYCVAKSIEIEFNCLERNCQIFSVLAAISNLTRIRLDLNVSRYGFGNILRQDRVIEEQKLTPQEFPPVPSVEETMQNNPGQDAKCGGAKQTAAAAGHDQCADRRTGKRKTMCAAGLLTAPGLMQPIPCKVVDFSGFGARLCFEPDVARYQLGWIKTPHQMKLTIVAERTEAECSIVWRSGLEMGVRLKYALRGKKAA